MDPTLILFAIQAGVKLGQKFYDVLIDANRERPLYLPFGDIFGSIEFNQANTYFRDDENGQKLFGAGGIYENVKEDNEIEEIYHYVMAVMQQCGVSSLTDEVYKLIIYRHNINQNLKDQLPKKGTER